jgi:hypothetical protein
VYSHLYSHILSQAMGAVTVRHFARLMPHLLRWLHSPEPATAAAAIAALRVIVLRCWPRMPAHALLIGRHLQASCCASCECCVWLTVALLLERAVLAAGRCLPHGLALQLAVSCSSPCAATAVAAAIAAAVVCCCCCQLAGQDATSPT